MQVEIDVPNPMYHLQPGMYADVQLSAGGQANVLTVPLTAIQRRGAEISVLVVDSQNRVEKRTVTTGIQSSNNVEIVSGLSAGEKVIVGNTVSYREGELVRPKESTPLSASGEAE
jgi:multidrug efflux pump subunit AcrA (membrane-fusion protein)